MSKENLEYSANEAIVETQEESEDDDEVTFRFFVNGEIVSWAKTLLYSYLKEIHSAVGEKRKGYGGKLLSHIEKAAMEHGATAMKACFVVSCSSEAVGFFRSMGYGLKPIEKDAPRFLEFTKKL
jgi:ribosomal protein S18 acetylase RimI-like enzyme